ncbi:PREDICTED: ubiquitin carboxyl-terminal hydrolase 21-like [Ipomoea nil]|uniref:ubiquitin carboxyl-terminal hydrolase 21-like n=1 Tax=Ipomoea nil TaxID=35883 RepID=UPI0009009B19|nr:PREDICTED: ubiquitin carboxyl-terminal hydrolase 21-like [Ipomoea nil]XP_019156216.1 PREDICTED: ubiquitin carboxyl-terminal hydrolase 21-like [Ipomoea nil]
MSGFTGGSSESTGWGNGEGDLKEVMDDLGLDSLPAVRSSSSYSHWSKPWSSGSKLEPTTDPKLYGGLDPQGSEPDWTDSWSAGNVSKHDLPFSVYGTSGLASKSKWEAAHTVSNWSAVKELVEVGLDTKPQEEEEPVAVEDNIFANSFYGGLDPLGSGPDWTDSWSAGNGSKHDLPFSVYRTSGFDGMSLGSESKWEAPPTVSSWSDVKELVEVGLETGPFIPSEAEREQEEEEPVAVEDNIFANSFFWDDKSLLVGGGLANLGNTCFLNSVLQCFMHIVPLIQSIEACDHPSPCEACNEGFCVLCALKELMNISLASKGSTIRPKKIVNNLSYFSSTFQRFQQGDAHEFLQCFLERLESCCNYPKLNGQVSPKHENVVKQTFGGHLISKLQCCNCGHRSDTYEPLVDLSLEIEDVDSLSLALDSFTKVERIEDPETKFTCEKCKVQVSIEKQLLLDEAPLVATFHLKRFKNDGSLVEKIAKHVTFPPELDLLPYVERNEKVIEESKYNLFAVVVHIGVSLSSGHYYCFVHASPSEWYKFDDSKVTRVQENVVMSQEAYILFYVKQGTPWFSEIIETQQLILDASISNSSPQPVLYSVDQIFNPYPKMETDRPCDVNETDNAADEASSNVDGPKDNGIDRSDGKENSNVVSALIHEGMNNSSDICSAEAEKTPPPSVLKEKNCKQEFRISKRFADLTTETPSISPSLEIYREDTADNAYSPPRALLRPADEVNHPEGEKLVKKKMPSTRGSALKGSHNESCMKKRRRRVEGSPTRERSSSTRRSSRLRSLTATSFR